MTAPLFPAGLSEIHDRYDAILCDVWGVIHNGREAFHDACDALAAFRKEGKPVILVTNAPVQAREVEALFPGFGVRRDCYNAIASSGDATRLVIDERAPGPAYRLGTDNSWERDNTLFVGSGLEFSEPENAAFIVAMGMRDQANEHPEDYREELRPLAKRGLEMIRQVAAQGIGVVIIRVVLVLVLGVPTAAGARRRRGVLASTTKRRRRRGTGVVSDVRARHEATGCQHRTQMRRWHHSCSSWCTPSSSLLL